MRKIKIKLYIIKKISAALLLIFISSLFFWGCGRYSYNKPKHIHMKTEKNIMLKEPKDKITVNNIKEPALSDEKAIPHKQNNASNSIDIQKLGSSKGKNEANIKASLKVHGVRSEKTKKTAYLTFDDGPSSSITPKILEILKKYNIKATFFVIGKNAEANKEIVTAEINNGHVVGNHTYSHDTTYIYSKPENCIDDFNKCNNLLKSIIPNYHNRFVRFPGGSKVAGKACQHATLQAGYYFYDWNCLSKDAEGINVPVNALFNEVKATSFDKDTLIILMHDSGGKETTVLCLPAVIEYLKSQGYSFSTLK